MAEFATKGVGTAGLTTGIIGSALGVLNGGLGNLLGNMTGNNGCCSEDHLVNRYEAAQQAKIAELETAIKLRDANTYTDGKILDLYRYVDNKFACVEGQISQQAVYNATNTATLSCLQQQVAQLASLTKVVIPADSICPAPTAATGS